MYILYDYDVRDKIIDNSIDEADIIDTMGMLLSKSIGQRFLIIHYEENKAPDTRSIWNVRDYYNYVTEYNEKLKNKSCLELKREIIKRSK